MKIPCFRCGKKIKDADSTNADYIIAADCLVKEPRDVLIALKHNIKTLEKKAKIIKDNTTYGENGEIFLPTEDFILNQFQDNEYDAVEIPTLTDAVAHFGPDLIKVIASIVEKDIQKTGLICRKCYKPTDTVIWGIHKLPP